MAGRIIFWPCLAMSHGEDPSHLGKGLSMVLDRLRHFRDVELRHHEKLLLVIALLAVLFAAQGAEVRGAGIGAAPGTQRPHVSNGFV